MKKVLVLILSLGIAMASFAGSKDKANKDTENFRYELECAGNAVQGNYLVKVWSYSRKPAVAMEQCKKNAVHGVIFKGFTGANGCVSQRALASNPGVETEFEDYFDSFFSDGGEYLKYVQLTSGSKEVIKLKREYKVGVTVTVQKDQLRKALEHAGVIKSLSSGF